MSELKPPRDPVEAMGEAYELMLERISDNYHKLERKAAPEMAHLLAEAREKAVELGELSREEADKLAEYLRRDLEDAGRYLGEAGNDFKDWLGFESSLLGDRLLDLFKKAADKTTLELMKLESGPETPMIYNTGEVTGIGTLVCTACGETLHFKKPGRIPPCPKCHATLYQRPTDIE